MSRMLGAKGAISKGWDRQMRDQRQRAHGQDNHAGIVEAVGEENQQLWRRCALKTLHGREEPPS